MGELIIGLIFLVGVVAVIGIILKVVFGVAKAGKRAVTGLAKQPRRVRGEWRGLPIPVDAKKLMDVPDVPSDSPPPPGHHVVFSMPGSHFPSIVQWFHDTWTQAGYIEEDFRGSSTDAVLTVRKPDDSGTVMAAFQLRYRPRYLVAVVLSDLCEAE